MPTTKSTKKPAPKTTTAKAIPAQPVYQCQGRLVTHEVLARNASICKALHGIFSGGDPEKMKEAMRQGEAEAAAYKAVLSDCGGDFDKALALVASPITVPQRLRIRRILQEA